MSRVVIRQEKPEDYRRVEELCRKAFWNLYFPGAEEHLVVHKLREAPDYMRELSFVLELEGKIIGAIFFTRSCIVTGNEEIPTVTFGPVFIAPGYQRQGYGRILIGHAIEKARQAGHRAILTLGYVYHYAPYGFQSSIRYGISSEDGRYYEGLLALPLYEGALDDISGYVRFSSVFEVDKSELEAFDSDFPFLEKRWQCSQDEYEKASSKVLEKM